MNSTVRYSSPHYTDTLARFQQHLRPSNGTGINTKTNSGGVRPRWILRGFSTSAWKRYRHGGRQRLGSIEAGRLFTAEGKPYSGSRGSSDTAFSSGSVWMPHRT